MNYMTDEEYNNYCVVDEAEHLSSITKDFAAIANKMDDAKSKEELEAYSKRFSYAREKVMNKCNKLATFLEMQRARESSVAKDVILKKYVGKYFKDNFDYYKIVSVSFVSDDMHTLRGCVLSGIFCKLSHDVNNTMVSVGRKREDVNICFIEEITEGEYHNELSKRLQSMNNSL